MQVVKSVRISLTMGNIVDNLNQLSKQQIIQKFRLLLDRKQIQINEKIQRNNAEHLLVLQKKMLILQRKDDQIIKLNNTITSLNIQLNDQRMRNNDLTDQAFQNKLRATHFEKKSNEFDNILKDEKAKRQKIKKQHDKLQIQHKYLVQQHQSEVRAHKKLKDEKTNWQEQTEMLLNNWKKTHQTQIQIKLKNIKLQYQNKLSDLAQFKNKYQNQKQKHIELKLKAANLNKTIQILNKQILNQKNKQKKVQRLSVDQQSQTDSSLLQAAYLQGHLLSKQFLMAQKLIGFANNKKAKKQIIKEDQEIQTQVYITVCQQCKNLKHKIQQCDNQIKILKHKAQKIQRPQCVSNGTQTNPIPVIVTESNTTQTIFSPLSNQQQNQLVQTVKRLTQISNKLIKNKNKNYEEIEQIFLTRPSKKQDIQKINHLQKTIILHEMQILEKQKNLQQLTYLNNQLHQKIAQQAALLKQFNINQLELQFSNNSNRFNTISQITPQSTIQQSKFKNFFRQNLSFTISAKQSRSKYKSYSSSLSKKDRNFSRAQSLMEYKNQYQSQSLKIQKQTPKKLQKFKDVLLQKGIVFKEKVKKQVIHQQIADLRQYKKYSSFKKSNN